MLHVTSALSNAQRSAPRSWATANPWERRTSTPYWWIPLFLWRPAALAASLLSSPVCSDSILLHSLLWHADRTCNKNGVH